MARISAAIVIAFTVAAAVMVGTARVSAHGPIEGERASNLTALGEQANLVLIGRVAEVSYREARIEGGEGELPYTVVTYEVREVLRGKAPGEAFTMRFPGGSDGRGHFVAISGVPVFQEGEEDLLFVSGNGETGCPLVECEWGRFRILRNAVYNTHGSPVRGLIEYHAVARGLPPEEFRKFSYPAPSFDELVKNPEAESLIKTQQLGLDEARRRYTSEAPKRIEVLTVFPEAPAKKEADGLVAAESPPGEERAGGDTKEATTAPVVKLGSEAVPLGQFVSAVKDAVRNAKRAPVEVRSVDPTADMIVRITPEVPAQLPAAKVERRAATPEEEAEIKALEGQNFDPVLKR